MHSVNVGGTASADCLNLCGFVHASGVLKGLPPRCERVFCTPTFRCEVLYFEQQGFNTPVTTRSGSRILCVALGGETRALGHSQPFESGSVISP